MKYKNTDASNDNKTPCEKCKKIKPDVRFEGSEEGFFCDSCLYEMKGGFN